MAEKSISEQIIDGFIERIQRAEILDDHSISKLKAVLESDRPKKADILAAISEGGPE